MKKWLNVRVAALVVLVAATCAVFFWKQDGERPAEPEPVRPIKSMVVGGAMRLADLYFPGTLDAAQGVDLSFEVGGRLVALPVKKGQRVKKGDLVAKLDTSDFDNQVKNAKAAVEFARSSFERIERALESHAVSREEWARAKASMDQAESQLSIAKKARKDAELRAKFDGLVATTYVDNYAMVQAGSPVAKLQGAEELTIDISVPESYVVYGGRLNEASYCTVLFDSLPGLELEATFLEFSTAADPVTQTYRATFTLAPPPEGVVLVPGMTSTLVIHRERVAGEKAAESIAVPSDAVGRDSAGSPFVWRLDATGAGVYEAHRATVELGVRSGETVAIRKGLQEGDCIALAGITVLEEGRQVRLLEDSPDAIDVSPAARAAEAAAVGGTVARFDAEPEAAE